MTAIYIFVGMNSSTSASYKFCALFLYPMDSVNLAPDITYI